MTSQYSVSFTIFAHQSVMTWTDMAADPADAKAQAITYFENGGNGPLIGLTETTDEDWTPDSPEYPADGDYGVLVTDNSAGL